MKKIIIAAVAALILLAADSGPLAANGFGRSGSIDNDPYISPTPGEITVMAMGPYFENNGPRRQDFVDIRDCGFNVTMLTTSVSGFMKAFEAMKGTGVKMIIHNPDLLDFRYNKAFVDKFINNSDLVGWDLIDEPRYENLDHVAECYKALRQMDPSRMIFMNLAGGTARIFTGPYRHYPAYLQLVQEKIAPGVWSYDYYPVTLDSEGNRVVGRYFYYDLECFMRQSAQTSRPFWYYVLGQEFVENGVRWPLPNEAEFRFGVFSALAYGAQGISYWSYCVRQNVDGSGVDHITALVGRDGRKTSAWHAARQVNSEIKRFNDVFTGSHPIAVGHTGNSLMMGTSRLELPFGPLVSFECSGKGAMLSLVANGRERYLVVVSHDIASRQRVEMEFSSDFQIVELTSPDGDNRKFSDARKTEGRSVSRYLSPGGYMIFKWSE